MSELLLPPLLLTVRGVWLLLMWTLLLLLLPMLARPLRASAPVGPALMAREETV